MSVTDLFLSGMVGIALFSVCLWLFGILWDMIWKDY